MGQGVFLDLTVFIACLVEMVEALTIVLALGITRGWRSVLLAASAAVVTLGVIVAVFGAALTHVVGSSDETINSPVLLRLWLILGILLLIFGLQWVRKAVLRYAGILASRDEDEAFAKLTREAKTAKTFKQTIDWYSFVAAYKGVLLEGFEVIFIVITFGVTQGNLRAGVLSAIAAFLVIMILGAVVHRPLSRVPENLMKLIVGILLTTFGTYFSVLGIGGHWPHGDAAVWFLLPFYAALSYGLIRWLKTVTYKGERTT